MPKKRSWTLEACQEILASWKLRKLDAQTPEAIHLAEQFISDMTTGEWLDEANQRYWVDRTVRNWISKALLEHGYGTQSWSDGLGSPKLVMIWHLPAVTPQPLPGWLLIGDIEVMGSERVTPGFHSIAAFIRSELQ